MIRKIFKHQASLLLLLGLSLALMGACGTDSDEFTAPAATPAANNDGFGSARSGSTYPEADGDLPNAEPKMKVTDSTGLQDVTEFIGSAPIHVSFSSNVTNLGDYTPLYEWHVYKSGQEQNPYLVRTDADFEYDFKETGKSYISLQISFVKGTDTVEYALETPFSVEAQSSVLNVPNAFSPNGDGTNDTLRVKQDYRSIISFHAYVFNRQGVKIYEWTDITKGWDGKHNGKDVPDGVYILKIEARGADGKHYNIRQVISLLRGYTYNSAAGTT
ncbi:MAG: gliding motility-associated C-terminal domain-containing protein [Bacteroidales bacterium]|jgi:gliding motility-associated-like protein|nr:gliding motility-associated C-terminal domain-containing protein [Bacteroidales bacterium]